MEIKIERGIDIPRPIVIRMEKGLKQTLREMGVGESFFYPKENSLRIAAYSVKKETSEKQFTVSSESKGGIIGARVWRIK